MVLTAILTGITLPIPPACTASEQQEMQGSGISHHSSQEAEAAVSSTREEIILGALNGQPGKPAMCIPGGTNQLVVVSSRSWEEPTGQLQVFERGPGAGATWHAVEGFSWPVNLGHKGMGWAAGGVIKTPELIIDGRLERTGGPQEMADGSGKLDRAGHAAAEGDAKTSAGLFKIGLAWGAALKAPEGTRIPYKHIDPFYRVIPASSGRLKDEQGHVLNGQVIRELNPLNGKYERYDRHSGQFVEGLLPTERVLNVIADKTIPKYHMLIKNVQDSSGRVLTGLLVKMNESEIKFRENGLPQFEKGMLVHYSSLDPKTGKPGPTGTLDMSAAKNVYRESDYRWSDHADRGHAIVGHDRSGKPVLSHQIDNLYNLPVRIVDMAAGIYERLDPNTGEPHGLGFLDPDTMRSLVNNDEQMTDERYKWAIDVRQNVDQLKDRGSAIFIHDEDKNIEEGRPSGTLGCTSMSERRMQQLLQRLENNAMILQVPIDELNTVVEALRPR
jgi:hypothetical protein